MPEVDGISTFDCIMDPARITDVSPSVSGLIETVDVVTGQRVTKGQPIAKMRSSLAKASLAILEARAKQEAKIKANEVQVAFLRRKRDRAQTLVDQNVQSQSQLDETDHEYALALSMLEQARFEKASAEAEVARARIELDELVIRAPNDGIIVDVLAEPGEFTSIDRPILRMAQLNPLRIAAYLPIELFAFVAVGQVMTVYPTFPVDGQFEVPLTTVDVVFDTASRTFGIRADLPNPEGAVPAGQRCVVQLKPNAPASPDTKTAP